MSPPSALRPGGSTSRWRRIRRAVLDRDGMRCRVELVDGRVHDIELTEHDRTLPTHATVDHVVARADAPVGFDVDHPSNLRAACADCNGRRSAERTNRRRVGRVSSRW